MMKVLDGLKQGLFVFILYFYLSAVPEVESTPSLLITHPFLESMIRLLLVQSYL